MAEIAVFKFFISHALYRMEVIEFVIAKELQFGTEM